MAIGMSGKIRKGQATMQGMPKFSRKDVGVVYKDTDKVLPPMPAKHPIAGVSKQSNK
jgi:hypothetical protein